MFDQQWWRLLVRCWEVAASNPLFELGIWGWPLGLGLLGALASRRLWLPRLALALRRVQLRKRSGLPSKDFRDRDLNV